MKFIIKTDILTPVISATENRFTYTFTFEIGFNQKHSLQLTSLCGLPGRIDREEFTLQTIGEYKFFFSKEKLYSGFYSGIYFKMSDYSYKSGNDYTNDNYLEYQQRSIGGGIAFGYQTYFKNRWVIDGIVGIGIRKITDTEIVKANTSFVPRRQTSTDGRAALNIGYKF